MTLLNIVNILRGYIVVLVEGCYIERFINICTRRKIFLWNIKKTGNFSMKMNISIKGFKSLRPVAYKTRCKVKILKKKGVPFILYRHRRREAFFGGVLLFIFIIFYMASFIWVIEIEGNEEVDKTEILMNLSECGLRTGSFKHGLDIDKIENLMMLKQNELSWLGIEIKGTKAMVELKERKQPPDIVDKHIPCNIIATKDAVIKNMVIKNGYPVVKEGDTVTAGQLLVSGIVDSKVEGIRYLHSGGSILGRTWYEKVEEALLIKENRIKTGDNINRYSIKLLDYKINLYINSSISYANYDKISNSNSLSLGKQYIFPIALQKDQYEEVIISRERVDKETVIKEVSQRLKAEILSGISEENRQVLDESIEYERVNNEKIIIKYTMECLEEIGVEDEIIK